MPTKSPQLFRIAGVLFLVAGGLFLAAGFIREQFLFYGVAAAMAAMGVVYITLAKRQQ